MHTLNCPPVGRPQTTTHGTRLARLSNIIILANRKTNDDLISPDDDAEGRRWWWWLLEVELITSTSQSTYHIRPPLNILFRYYYYNIMYYSQSVPSTGANLISCRLVASSTDRLVGILSTTYAPWTICMSSMYMAEDHLNLYRK